MDQQLTLKIQNHLARYLSGEITLEDFRKWFDVATWDAVDTATTAAQQLAGQIDLWLAEFSKGHWTESELREKLRPLARIVWTTQGSPWQTGATSSVTVSPVANFGSAVGIQAARVFGSAVGSLV